MDVERLADPLPVRLVELLVSVDLARFVFNISAMRFGIEGVGADDARGLRWRL